MNGIELIKPNSGQTGWGAAINKNFKTLYEKYKNTLSELQSLYDKINLLDIVHTSNDNFVYMPSDNNADIIKPTSGKTMSDTWRALSLGSLDSNGNQEEFKLEEYNNYDAFFVMTAADDKVTWQNIHWNTGDLLIVQKNTGSELSAYGAESTVKQWKNMMGGFYEPVSHVMEDNGAITTNYKKYPNVASPRTLNKGMPHVFYKPTEYNTTDENKLVFTPCGIDANGNENELEKMDSISLTLPANVYAITNIVDIDEFGKDIYINFENIDFSISDLNYDSTENLNVYFKVDFILQKMSFDPQYKKLIDCQFNSIKLPYQVNYKPNTKMLVIATNSGSFTDPSSNDVEDNYNMYTKHKLVCALTVYKNEPNVTSFSED